MSNKVFFSWSVLVVIVLFFLARWYGGMAGGAELAFSNAGSLAFEKLDGGSIALADYKGQKPVILDFFATWCPNCQRDMPVLDRFYDKYKEDVEVIGVNLQEPSEKVQEFVSSYGISFPVVLDPSGRASQLFGVRYTNTHILIDKEGNVTRVIPGDIREADITALIKGEA